MNIGRNMIAKIRKTIDFFLTGTAIFLMLSLVLFSFLQVVLRNFFAISLNVADEFMRNGVLWIAFVGAVLTTLRGKHISIDILPRYVKGKRKIYLDWTLTISAALICLVMTWYSVRFIILEIEMKSVIAGFCPAWIIESIIPVGFFLLAISFPLRLLDKSRKADS